MNPRFATLLRSPGFWFGLVFDLRWITPIFNGITWSNLWIYLVVSFVCIVTLIVFSFLFEAVAAAARRDGARKVIVKSGLSSPGSGYYGGASIHYLVSLALFLDPESLFLWFVHAVAGALRAVLKSGETSPP